MLRKIWPQRIYHLCFIYTGELVPYYSHFLPPPHTPLYPWPSSAYLVLYATIHAVVSLFIHLPIYTHRLTIQVSHGHLMTILVLLLYNIKPCNHST